MKKNPKPRLWPVMAIGGLMALLIFGLVFYIAALGGKSNIVILGTTLLEVVLLFFLLKVMKKEISKLPKRLHLGVSSN